MATAIIYWSGTGNTEAMAQAIEAGMKGAGAEVALFDVEKFDVGSIDSYDKLALGCPSMGAEVLEETIFEPFFVSIESKLSGKKVALFGSYGWGDGEWMRDWQERTKKLGANLFEEGFMQNEAPDEDVCKEFGTRLAAF